MILEEVIIFFLGKCELIILDKGGRVVFIGKKRFGIIKRFKVFSFIRIYI